MNFRCTHTPEIEVKYIAALYDRNAHTRSTHTHTHTHTQAHVYKHIFPNADLYETSDEQSGRQIKTVHENKLSRQLFVS